MLSNKGDRRVLLPWGLGFVVPLIKSVYGSLGPQAPHRQL